METFKTNLFIKCSGCRSIIGTDEKPPSGDYGLCEKCEKEFLEAVDKISKSIKPVESFKIRIKVKESFTRNEINMNEPDTSFDDYINRKDHI